MVNKPNTNAKRHRLVVTTHSQSFYGVPVALAEHEGNIFQTSFTAVNNKVITRTICRACAGKYFSAGVFALTLAGYEPESAK